MYIGINLNPVQKISAYHFIWLVGKYLVVVSNKIICLRLFSRGYSPLFSRTIRGSTSTINCFHIVWLAEDSVLTNAKLFPCAELSFARITGETGQVVDLLFSLSDPVGWRYHSATFETFSSKQPAIAGHYYFFKRYPGEYLQGWAVELSRDTRPHYTYL